ncbi:MAG: NADH-quinone oxidoreductase subunit NuoF [Peptococcaceae bacterium]|nr:NADH-quinone oxidoreductase subunit NuoF [Peptococcaceae bacterium]
MGESEYIGEIKNSSHNSLNGIHITQTGCPGMCYNEPLVSITGPADQPYIYGQVTPENARAIIASHIENQTPIYEWLVNTAPIDKTLTAMQDMPFFKNQKRIALANCGVVNPEKIEDYIAADGYFALARTLSEMQPLDVINEIKTSGLRGRGGGGFPTGAKWEFAHNVSSDQKYVVCNADEGDPGAFMDRSILEGDPHRLIEAMAIAGYAIGANQGYVYVRAEYPIALERLKWAIGQAQDKGLLGDHILGSAFSFTLDIRLGAGAFVCGEETALLSSIEGKRGEPRPRPPFPAVSGLWGYPTIINNVETYANVPAIILNGAAWFSAIGTEKSKGTKVFALAGKINNIGLIEIPMGTTLRTIIEDIGGGIPHGKKYKAAQTGGPSGGCIPTDMLDIEIDYDNLQAIGSMMGSGGLIVMDEDTCMVDIARFFLEFTQDESCGKCTPCRIGTKRMLETLDKITEGKGDAGDIDKLEALAHSIQNASICGLGQTAPNPVLSTLMYFRNEYEAHIHEKKCPAHACQEMLSYTILDDKCTSCSLCARVCPTDAISGKTKEPYKIDQDKCIKCGACMAKCKVGAIEHS